MTTKTTIVTSSTNIESRTTTTTTTTLPPWVMGLPRDQRDFNASRIVIGNNQPLENVKHELPNAIHPILEGKQESTFIRDGSVVNIFNIGGPNARVYINSQDRSTNIANVTPEEVFEELRNIIVAKIQEESERSKLLLRVQELERTKGTRVFVHKYSEFVALAANNLALFTPILPALTHWLVG